MYSLGRKKTSGNYLNIMVFTKVVSVHICNPKRCLLYKPFECNINDTNECRGKKLFAHRPCRPFSFFMLRLPSTQTDYYWCVTHHTLRFCIKS